MNPINQALVPVSSLPGPGAYPAVCSYVHLQHCPAGNLITPTSVNVMLLFFWLNKGLHSPVCPVCAGIDFMTLAVTKRFFHVFQTTT